MMLAAIIKMSLKCVEIFLYIAPELSGDTVYDAHDLKWVVYISGISLGHGIVDRVIDYCEKCYHSRK